MTLSNNKKRLLLMVLLVIGVFMLCTQITFADTVDWDDRASEAEDSAVIMDSVGLFTIDYDLSDFGIEKIGPIILNTLCNLVFAAMMAIAVVAVFTLEVSNEMGFLEDIVYKLEELLIQPTASLFKTDGSSDIMLYAIAVTLIGVVFAFMRMRMSDAVSKFMKIIGILAISLLLLTSQNSAILFMDLNRAASEITDSVSGNIGGVESSEAMIWDACVVKPWAMLNFNDITPKSWGTTATVNEAMANKGYTITKLKPAMGFLASRGNGDFIKAYLLMDDEDRKEAMITAGEHGEDKFTSWQVGRLLYSVVYLVLTLFIGGVSIILSLGILAVKFMAVILFFLWPVLALYAMFKSEGFQVLKRWFAVVIVMFVAGIVVQFVLAMLIAMIYIVMGNALTPQGLLASLIVIVAVVLAIKFGFRPLMMIIAPTAFRRVNTELRQMAMFRMMRNHYGSPGGQHEWGEYSGGRGNGGYAGDDNRGQSIEAPTATGNERTSEMPDARADGEKAETAENAERTDNISETATGDGLGQLHNGDEQDGELHTIDGADGGFQDNDEPTGEVYGGIEPNSEDIDGEEKKPVEFNKQDQERLAREGIKEAKEKEVAAQKMETQKPQKPNNGENQSFEKQKPKKEQGATPAEVAGIAKAGSQKPREQGQQVQMQKKGVGTAGMKNGGTQPNSTEIPRQGASTPKQAEPLTHGQKLRQEQSMKQGGTARQAQQSQRTKTGEMPKQGQKPKQGEATSRRTTPKQGQSPKQGEATSQRTTPKQSEVSRQKARQGARKEGQTPKAKPKLSEGKPKARTTPKRDAVPRTPNGTNSRVPRTTASKQQSGARSTVGNRIPKK